MAIDTNEIGGFISHCTNLPYLLNLRVHLNARIEILSPQPVEAVADVRVEAAAVRAASEVVQPEAEVRAEAVAIDAAGNVTLASGSGRLEDSTSTSGVEPVVALAADQAAEDAADPLPSRSVATADEVEQAKKARRVRKKKPTE